MAGSSRKGNVLISGAGIAGLTLAVLLKQRGWHPVIVERDDEIRTEGYMMDFFGTGWDVAERMHLVEDLRAVKYPIDRLEFVDRDGKAYVSTPISRVRDALKGRYVYLRRPDLQRILLERAHPLDVTIRFATSVDALEERDGGIVAIFNTGDREKFDFVFGTDGIHSGIRKLVFGPEEDFSFYLGGYVAAFHITDSALKLDHAFKLHEEIGRTTGLYPLDDSRVDATFVFHHPDVGHVPEAEQLDLLKEKMAGPGWISKQLLDEIPSSLAVYFDSLTQIRMPSWTRGRVALVGDSCGCLTLIAGQGSQMAMAGAFVLVNELERHRGDHAKAFRAYERALMPAVAARQRSAERFAGIFLRSADSRPWLRDWVTKLLFSRPVLPLVLGQMGARSALANYHA